jgi:Fe-S-cluster containining protein
MPREIEIDMVKLIRLDEIEAKAKKLEEQNLDFRIFLLENADKDVFDEKFLELHNELFGAYDCCKCHNCCKVCYITLTSSEALKIAKFIGMTKKDFSAQYLKKSSVYDQNPYKFKKLPCPFLCDDGKCRINECKPNVCAEYPYTDNADMMYSMYNIIDYAQVCPVVFEMLERLKVFFGFRKRRNSYKK